MHHQLTSTLILKPQEQREFHFHFPITGKVVSSWIYFVSYYFKITFKKAIKVVKENLIRIQIYTFQFVLGKGVKCILY